MPTVYGSFSVAADEERQELFYTVQHSGAVMVFNKKASARDNDVAVRMILGKSRSWPTRTGLPSIRCGS